MDRKMILYRGSLKSCNYTCSYCPFAKHPSSGREQEKDKEEWGRFCRSTAERAIALGAFALMVVPYGEALIHSWYWEGLAFLSRLEQAEAVGVQTNFSFSADWAVKLWEGAGGRKEKLRLWATFHPEMVSPEDFAQKCRRVQSEGFSLCVGAVGVPENLPLLNRLSRLLPDSVYLWINAMDGLHRAYTKEEEQAFSALDPFFIRELSAVCANPEYCKNRVFIEGNGRVQTCSLSGRTGENWYQENFSFPSPVCSRKICSCYLAYGGRTDWINHLLFGRYPVFRIPKSLPVMQVRGINGTANRLDAYRCFSAVFFDIDKTLLPEGEKAVPPLIAAGLEALKRLGTRLFFATSLPLPEARRRCKRVWPLFAGGVFAGGAHLWWKDEKSLSYDGKCQNPQKQQDQQKYQEILYTLDEALLLPVKEQSKRLHFRLSVCRRNGLLYKITLVRRRGFCWERTEESFLRGVLPETLKGSVRFLREENCMQMIPADASKENGVESICQRLGISLKQTAAVGDSAEDDAMLLLCSEGIKLHCIKQPTGGKNNH